MSSTGPEDSIQGAEDVVRAYEAAGFDEQPPPHVDRAILAAARRRPRPRLAAFVPAFALAATVILSFSLVLRSGMLGVGDVEAPTPRDAVPAREFRSTNEGPGEGSLQDDLELDASSPAGGFVDAPPEEGLSSPPEQRRERALSQPPPAALQQRAQPVASDADVGDGTSTPPAAQAEPELPGAATELEETAVLRSVVAPEAGAGCGETSGGEPSAWVECISRRFEVGADEIARLELEAFVVAHPDFPLPENLEALRAP